MARPNLRPVPTALLGALLMAFTMTGTAHADETPPATPTDVTAAPGDGYIALDWADSTAPDLHGFDIYRGGEWLAYSWESEYRDAGLTNGQTYSYSILAYDNSRNVSPLSSAVDSCSGFGTYGLGNWPPACWRPYAATSPFNRPIPDNPSLSSASGQIVSRVTGWGPPNKAVANYHDTSGDWSKPTYFSTPTDPLFTLDCTDVAGYCEPGIDGAQIRIPDAARPAGGGDRHVTVIDQAGRTEYDFWNVTSKPVGGGTLVFEGGGSTSLDGDGLSSGATAAGFGSLAGVIRPQELAAGHIDHALYMVARCDSGQYVYPAQRLGRRCSTIGESNVNAPPMGTHFQLNLSEVEIDAMSVPAWKKTIFKAMAEYGMYFGDTGGGNWAIQAESDSTYSSFGQTPQLLAFAQDNGWATWYNPAVGRTVRVGDFQGDIDWASKLRVIDPCVSGGSC